MSEHILIIDEGTTSTRALVYDRALHCKAVSQADLPLAFPKDGWVEQEGDAIWQATLQVCRNALDKVGGADDLVAVGLTNQRETTLIWDRETGRPVGPAIVWQDRRTATKCAGLREAGHEPRVRSQTGLLIDPYFSATKIAWVLDSDPDLRRRAEAGALAFGTVDTWLIWKLTGGARHATDVTNASRTLLYRLGLGGDGGWSQDMLDLFGVPRAVLPEVQPSASAFGETDPALFGRAVPILSAIGDQHAALVGQGCLAPGTAKITFGTGAFLVANTGRTRLASRHNLLATLGYETSAGAGAFALEGSIFNAGTVVKWLRDELGLIAQAADTEAMARDLPDNGGVYFVPAFTGLGAPHWAPSARGEITGLSRGTRAAHLVRAGLESCAYQTRDLLDAFAADGAAVETLRCDGGMAANDWLMQFLADICGLPVERPDDMEMTARGAATLVAFELGWASPDPSRAARVPVQRFDPAMPAADRTRLLAGWARAIDKAVR